MTNGQVAQMVENRRCTLELQILANLEPLDTSVKARVLELRCIKFK